MQVTNNFNLIIVVAAAVVRVSVLVVSKMQCLRNVTFFYILVVFKMVDHDNSIELAIFLCVTQLLVLRVLYDIADVERSTVVMRLFDYVCFVLKKKKKVLCIC